MMIFQKLTLAICLSVFTFSSFAGRTEFEEVTASPAAMAQLTLQEESQRQKLSRFQTLAAPSTRATFNILQPFLPENPLVLDLSARVGKNGEIITNALAGKGRYLGVDQEATNVALAQKLYPTLQFKIGFEEDYMEGVNFSSYYEDISEVETADVIFMMFLASKKNDPTGFLRSIYDRMKPGARMILMEPHQGYEDIEAKKRENPGVDPRLFDLRHTVLTKAGVDLDLVFQLDFILKGMAAEVMKSVADVCETGKQAKPRLRSLFTQLLEEDGSYPSEDRSAMLATVDTISDAAFVCSGQMHTFIARKPESVRASSSTTSQ
jgi:SAM-dependent methyltransferase